MPWDFDELDPWQVRQLLAGARARRREGWQQMAQLAAWLLAPYSKRRLKAKDLMTFPPDPLDVDEDPPAPPPSAAPRRRVFTPPRHG